MIDLQEEDEEGNENESYMKGSHSVLQKVKSNSFTQRPPKISSYLKSLRGQTLNLSTVFYDFARRPFDEKFIEIS